MRAAGPMPKTEPWLLQTHLELAALPSAPACARGHVRSVAMEWGMADLADTAELLASELTTNAVRASERLRTTTGLPVVPVVRLWLVSDQASIVIHVWDGDDHMPVRRNCGPDDESGRGLMLVENLGSDWGAYRKSDGKVVWVQISQSDAQRGVSDIA
jgi:anti-sigma regulatory factor (Ser/Thr protein kinase)